MVKLILVLISISLPTFAARVRNIEVMKDQVVTVRTSLGIATIIQVPDRPNSVVVGDLDAFKVEYLDQAITIKPLTGSAKSNLYVYTDWKRYNVELVTGSQQDADYVVYLKNPKQKLSERLRWKKFTNILRNEGITLTVSRLGKLLNELYLVEFSLSSEKQVEFRPEWIWITQGDQHRPIRNLILSDLALRPGSKVQGLLQVEASALDPSSPFRIELRRRKSSYLSVPKAVSWNI